MINEFSPDGVSWARFSDDRKMRYRIRRCVSLRAVNPSQLRIPHDLVTPLTKVTFLMLNPSKAGAKKTDQTWTKCCTFARDWNADVCEGANLHAFISSSPKSLWAQPIGQRGDDAIADREILEACRDSKVVAAWGSDGDRDGRATYVLDLLSNAGIDISRLDVPLTDNGQPKHPLARGKHFIPPDTKPVAWVVKPWGMVRA